MNERTTADWPLVYSVVVNYRSPEETRTCLNSLRQLDYPDHEVILVNNDDDFEAAAELQQEFPKCTVITTGENLGFSSGYNVGIRRALANGAEYVSILNYDVVLREDFLRNGLQTFRKHENVGMVGGKIYKYANGRTDDLWSVGGEMSWLRGKGVAHGFGETDNGQYDEVRDIEFIAGSQMLVKRAVFETVGLLPEAYFLGGEEWDYCHQVLSSGFRILYNPEMVVWHKVSHTAEESYSRYYNYYRNKLLFTRRAYSKHGWLLWLTLFLGYCHSGLWIKHREGRPAMVYKAAMHALKHSIVDNRTEITRSEYEAGLKRNSAYE